MSSRSNIMLGVLLLSTLVAGCATKHACCAGQGAHQTAQPSEYVDLVELERVHSPSAAALVFDPPMYASELGPELAREGRERSAFVAYEGQTTTFSYIRIDDRQTGDDRERYERRAVIERFGTSTR